jgi:hypothetical protein
MKGSVLQTLNLVVMNRILLLFISILIWANASYAQSKKVNNNIKKKRTTTVRIVTAPGATPDSIQKQIIVASEKILKDYLAKHKNATDSIISADAWTSYKSSVLGNANNQVTINLTIHRKKVKNKMVVTNYVAKYGADQDLFDVYYDKAYKKPSVRYNESYWPGFMYNDKASTPKSKDLNKDIGILMKKIARSGVMWKDAPANYLTTK